MAAGALGGFAPMANVSRSLAARGAGAHSQLFQVAGAGIVLFVLFTGGPLVARLPLAALAAVIIVVSVPRLIDVPGFLLLWRSWRTESLIALAAAAGVVVFGVLPGVLVAVLLASGQLVRRAARPPDAVLAVTGADEPPREVAEHEAAGLDVLIYRVDAPLFFANAARVRERILALTSAGEPSLRYVILDAEAVFYLDATAAQLTVDLGERGCRLLLARTRTPVLATLRANPYYDGATRELPAFPSVRQAHAAAQEGTV